MVTEGKCCGLWLSNCTKATFACNCQTWTLFCGRIFVGTTTGSPWGTTRTLEEHSGAHWQFLKDEEEAALLVYDVDWWRLFAAFFEWTNFWDKASFHLAHVCPRAAVYSCFRSLCHTLWTRRVWMLPQSWRLYPTEEGLWWRSGLSDRRTWWKLSSQTGDSKSAFLTLWEQIEQQCHLS